MTDQGPDHNTSELQTVMFLVIQLCKHYNYVYNKIPFADPLPFIASLNTHSTVDYMQVYRHSVLC